MSGVRLKLFTFFLVVLFVMFDEMEAKKQAIGKKHKHGNKKGEEKEEEDEDKKIKCFECGVQDQGNCTETGKDCKYCFTFNATDFVEKGCLTKQQSNDVDDTDECKYIIRNSVNGTMCYCDDDLCNETVDASMKLIANSLLAICCIFLTTFLVKT